VRVFAVIDSLRQAIRTLAGYVPGEQPREGAFVKLNTNENPYPPSPRVFEALHAAITGDLLRRYPDPAGTHFRKTAGRLLDLDPDSILIGNGSDDVLTVLTRSFVPEGGQVVSPAPSYLLYATLAALQGAKFGTVPYVADGLLPHPWPLPDAHLTFVANPNSPTGHAVSRDQLQRLASTLAGPLVVDEAYADFADGNALDLVRSGTLKVVVTRSFSKSYSLAGIRLGFAVAAPEVVRHLLKVKDSYNCDVLSLSAGAAALEDQEYFRTIRAKVLATRARMEKEFTRLAFRVTPSQANFVWCRSDRPVKPIYEELKRRHILVRYMNYEGYGEGLRISVGTDAEIDRLMDELKKIL
jgi:histidinol-phosphate aminotransferase